jgi:hypothetical protein
MNLGFAQKGIAKRIVNPTFLATFPLVMMCLSQNLIDDLNMFSAVPASMWTGISLTAMYYQSRSL